MFHGRRVGTWMPLRLYVISVSILGSVSPCSSSTSISTTFYHPEDGWWLRIRRHLWPQERKTQHWKSDREDVTGDRS
ncbi:hypothetical protein EV421DRAFT_1836055, partial [Armillaria borealis]